MTYQALQLRLVNGNVLRIDHPSLPATPATFLTAASLAGATALTVRDNSNFSNALGGDLLLIGDYGSQETEIKLVTGVVTPGTSLTVSANIFPHPLNTSVHKVLFDKVEIYGNTVASSAGATLITTVSINSAELFTEYVVTGSTFAYYGVRAIRSVATTYNGEYSDFISATGFDTNSVGYIIQQAFTSTGIDIVPEGKLSKQWAYDQIFLGEQDISKELKKWSWLQKFEYDAGNISFGVNHFTLPTDLSDRNTPKAIQGLRIGKGVNLNYISKAEFEYLFQNVAQTTVGTSYSASASTVILTDSRDFDDSGSYNIYTGGVVNGVSYTTNTRATNTLTGVTLDTSAGTAGDPIWQGEPQGLPSRYTIYNGEVYFDAIPDTSSNLVGTNIWMDYYKNITRVNTDGDTITVPDSLCIQYWLETQIKRVRNNGVIAADDTSWINYQTLKKRLIQNETSGQGTYLIPRFFSDNYYGQTY